MDSSVINAIRRVEDTYVATEFGSYLQAFGYQGRKRSVYNRNQRHA